VSAADEQARARRRLADDAAAIAEHGQRQPPFRGATDRGRELIAAARRQLRRAPKWGADDDGRA
jgi:hypothetical protein